MMDFNAAKPYARQPTDPELPSKDRQPNQNRGQSVESHTLRSASATPLPPSSPVASSHMTPRMRMERQYVPSSSPSPKPFASRPLNQDRRSSTPLQTQRSMSNIYHSANLNTPPRPLSRRASSNILSSSTNPAQSRSVMGSAPKEVGCKPGLTAAEVAQDYFKKDLGAVDSSDTSSQTIVIFRDACYGHRYSRPRTSKAALNTIVERPERLLACVLGASAAYVRLGGRHAGGKHPPHPDQKISEPPFKIRKLSTQVSLRNTAVTQVHGSKWMEELQIMCDSAEGKLAMNGKELVRPIGYGKDEAGSPLHKLHEGDLYLCAESLDALQGCLGGVCEAVDAVLGPGNAKRAFVCIRPPGHHCSSNYPSGFCWLNNVHVGIAHAANSQGLTHAAIIDFDLHHGDGSQSIAWDHNRKAAGNLPKNASPYGKTPIGYFSVHDINSYPCEWGDEEKIKNASLCVENAHGQSIWNVHLEPWKNHTDFWKLYESRYRVLLDKTRVFLRHHTKRLEDAGEGSKAKAAIFLSAGFDASEWEGAGMQRHKVNVPTDFYARFTADVVRLASEEGLGVDGRIISVLEGGYSDRALTSGIMSHLCGLTSSPSLSSSMQNDADQGLASAMAKQMGMVDTKLTNNYDELENMPFYDSDWWSPHHLEALEDLVHPAPVPEVRLKDKAASNYSSPTHASTAKMIEVARTRRSLSIQHEARMGMEAEPVPPPPEVYWDVAAYELSQLLIPSDRQTLSCRHDELTVEATKVRRERQSSVGLPANPIAAGLEPRMQLRDRKSKAPVIKEASKADRRRTIAAVGGFPEPALAEADSRSGDGIAVNRPRRRSSAGSSILSAFDSMKLNEGGSEASSSARDTKAVFRGTTKASNLPPKTAKVPLPKKPKPPVAPRTQSAKLTTSLRGAPPAPIVHQHSSNMSSQVKQERDTLPAGAVNRQSSLESAPSVKSATSQDEVMDTISSGFRKMKINLKVPSPEENAARERKAAEEKEKLKKPRAVRKPAGSKGAKSHGVAIGHDVLLPTFDAIATQKESSSGAPSATGLSEPAASDLPGFESQEQKLEAKTNGQANTVDSHVLPSNGVVHAGPPMEPTIPAPVRAPLPQMDGPVAIDTDLGDINEPTGKVIPYEPATSVDQLRRLAPAIPSEMPHMPNYGSESVQPVSFLPTAAQTSPPSSKKTKADLPRFTSSSPIPFATQILKAGTDSAKRYSGLEAGVPFSAGRQASEQPLHAQAVPNSPHYPTQDVNQRPQALSEVPNPNGSSESPRRTMMAAESAPDSLKVDRSGSAADQYVWEIPETPVPAVRR